MRFGSRGFGADMALQDDSSDDELLRLWENGVEPKDDTPRTPLRKRLRTFATPSPLQHATADQHLEQFGSDVTSRAISFQEVPPGTGLSPSSPSTLPSEPNTPSTEILEVHWDADFVFSLFCVFETRHCVS